jgi:hypothetical protein
LPDQDARSAAQGQQFDLLHALRVASRVDDLDAKLVAILHDAVEDGACDFTDLIDADLPDDVLGAIHTLTRGENETYADYIDRVRDKGGELAKAVKLDDLDANLARLDEEHASLEGRYRKAIRTLTEEG